MSARSEELAGKRRGLQQRCATQRRELGRSALELQERLATVDRGISVVRRLVSSPIIIVAAVALVAVAGPARLLRWTSQALLLRSVVRRVSGN